MIDENNNIGSCTATMLGGFSFTNDQLDNANQKVKDISFMINNFNIPDIGIHKLNPLEQKYLNEIIKNPNTQKHIYDDFMIPLEQHLPLESNFDIQLPQSKNQTMDILQKYTDEIITINSTVNNGNTQNVSNALDILELKTPTLSPFWGYELATIIKALNNQQNSVKTNQTLQKIGTLQKFIGYEFQESEFVVVSGEEYQKQINDFLKTLKIDGKTIYELESDKKRIFDINVDKIFPIKKNLNDKIEMEKSTLLIWNDKYQLKMINKRTDIEGTDKKMIEINKLIEKIDTKLIQEKNAIVKFGLESDPNSNISNLNKLIKNIPELLNSKFGDIIKIFEQVVYRASIQLNEKELEKEKNEWYKNLTDDTFYGLDTIRRSDMMTVGPLIRYFIDNSKKTYIYKSVKGTNPITDIILDSDTIIERLSELLNNPIVKNSKSSDKLSGIIENFRKFILKYKSLDDYKNKKQLDAKISPFLQNNDLVSFLKTNPDLVLQNNMLEDNKKNILDYENKKQKFETEKNEYDKQAEQFKKDIEKLENNYINDQQHKEDETKKNIKILTENANIEIGKIGQKDGLDKILQSLAKVDIEIDKFKEKNTTEKWNNIIDMNKINQLNSKIEIYVSGLESRVINNEKKKIESKLEDWDQEYTSGKESLEKMLGSNKKQFEDENLKLTSNLNELKITIDLLQMFGNDANDTSNISILTKIITLRSDLRGKQYRIILDELNNIDKEITDITKELESVEAEKKVLKEKVTNPLTFGVTIIIAPTFKNPKRNIAGGASTNTSVGTLNKDAFNTFNVKTTNPKEKVILDTINKINGYDLIDNKNEIIKELNEIRKHPDFLQLIPNEKKNIMDIISKNINDINEFYNKYTEINNKKKELDMIKGVKDDKNFIIFLEKMKNKIIPIDGNIINKFKERKANLEKQVKTITDTIKMLKGTIDNMQNTLNSMASSYGIDKQLKEKQRDDSILKIRPENIPIKYYLKTTIDDEQQQWYNLHLGGSGNDIKFNPSFQKLHDNLKIIISIIYRMNKYDTDGIGIIKDANNYVNGKVDNILVKNEKLLLIYNMYVLKMCTDIETKKFIPKYMLYSNDIGKIILKINNIYNTPKFYDTRKLIQIVLGRAERCCNKMILVLRDKPGHYIDVIKSSAIIDILLAIHVTSKINL